MKPNELSPIEDRLVASLNFDAIFTEVHTLKEEG